MVGLSEVAALVYVAHSDVLDEGSAGVDYDDDAEYADGHMLGDVGWILVLISVMPTQGAPVLCDRLQYYHDHCECVPLTYGTGDPERMLRMIVISLRVMSAGVRGKGTFGMMRRHRRGY